MSHAVLWKPRSLATAALRTNDKQDGQRLINALQRRLDSHGREMCPQLLDIGYQRWPCQGLKQHSDEHRFYNNQYRVPLGQRDIIAMNMAMCRDTTCTTLLSEYHNGSKWCGKHRCHIQRAVVNSQQPDRCIYASDHRGDHCYATMDTNIRPWDPHQLYPNLKPGTAFGRAIDRTKQRVRWQRA